MRPAPGKMMAVQKWTPPPNITALRAFLGLCNYYSSYVHMYAEYAAPLQEKLKVPKEEGKAGIKARVEWSVSDLAAFEKLKEVLVKDLLLYNLDPMKPFGLRTDASDYAVGAALEQFPNHTGVPPLEEIVKPGVSRPVAFMSRKLTTGQMRKWDTRDKETYAIVSALTKWASWIGYQPVICVTDHKTLESWYKEAFSQAMGPSARRARWHATLSLFRVEVVYHPGKKNVVGDGLSRWGYPASEAWADVSKHGSAEDRKVMKELIQREIEEERGCRQVYSKAMRQKALRRARNKCLVRLTLRPGPEAAAHIAGVTTRMSTKTDENTADMPVPKPPPSQSSNTVPKSAPLPKPALPKASPAKLMSAEPSPQPETPSADISPRLASQAMPKGMQLMPMLNQAKSPTTEPDPAQTTSKPKPKPKGRPKKAAGPNSTTSAPSATTLVSPAPAPVAAPSAAP